LGTNSVSTRRSSENEKASVPISRARRCLQHPVPVPQAHIPAPRNVPVAICTTSTVYRHDEPGQRPPYAADSSISRTGPVLAVDDEYVQSAGR